MIIDGSHTESLMKHQLNPDQTERHVRKTVSERVCFRVQWSWKPRVTVSLQKTDVDKEQTAAQYNVLSGLLEQTWVEQITNCRVHKLQTYFPLIGWTKVCLMRGSTELLTGEDKDWNTFNTLIKSEVDQIIEISWNNSIFETFEVKVSISSKNVKRFHRLKKATVALEVKSHQQIRRRKKSKGYNNH